MTPTTIMYNFFKGIVEAGKENIDGIWNFIKNPVKSAIEMAQGIAFLKRATTVGTEENIAFMSGIAIGIVNFAIGDGNEKARIIGKIAGEILITVLATKGMSALKNIIQDSAKAGKLAELIEIGKNRKIGSAEVGSIFERTGNAVVDSRKFSDYIFKDGATHGKDAVYRGLGYSKENSAELVKLYQEQASIKYANGEYTLGKLDQYGQRINIEIELPGIGNASGQTSYLKSGWMINSDGTISLNTPFAGFTK